ncbi:MAG TPA: acyl carrier protein [Burkholderiales bacterium]|jgi:acyl carrier protein|nr:acyl carrier protein [Burkholderiales bacterium]
MSDLPLRDRVIQRLLAASDAKLTAADVDDATSLRQDLDISSLILITLASELEDELGIDIDDEELGSIQTIGDLFRAVEGRKRQNRQA